MLVSDGDFKATSDMLRSSLRSRGSSQSGFRVSTLRENPGILALTVFRNLGRILQDKTVGGNYCE